MPTECDQLKNQPYAKEKCPLCGIPFPEFMRGQVQRSKRLLGVLWKRPYCAIICHECKNIIGWEYSNADKGKGHFKTHLFSKIKNKILSVIANAIVFGAMSVGVTICLMNLVVVFFILTLTSSLFLANETLLPIALIIGLVGGIASVIAIIDWAFKYRANNN